MSKILDNFKIGKHLIIIVDKIENEFNQIEINGVRYDVTIPYDIPNAISIEGDYDFIGETVNFI